MYTVIVFLKSGEKITIRGNSTAKMFLDAMEHAINTATSGSIPYVGIDSGSFIVCSEIAAVMQQG